MSAVAPKNPVRVLLIDDSPIIRLGLRSALEDSTALTIVGEAGTATDGIKAAHAKRPDVVLLDLNLPDRSGLEVCRELQRDLPDIHVLILTSDSNGRNVHAAQQAGAVGYLLKENDGETLTAAILSAAQGTVVLDQTLIQRASINSKTSSGSKLDLLSQQERKVVALLSGGLTNREIGDQLGLTEKTIKNYLSAIFTKLNITRRTQAAALHIESQQNR